MIVIKYRENAEREAVEFLFDATGLFASSKHCIFFRKQEGKSAGIRCRFSS